MNTSTPTPISIRKVCANCGMNAIHTNVTIELTGYGTQIIEDELHCQNCGETE